MKLVKLPYSSARDRIRDADILLFRGQSWYSRIVEAAGRSLYSHAGMAALWHGRLHLLQSTAFQDTKPLLSYVVSHRPGQIDVWRFKGELPEDAAVEVVKTMIPMVGRGYGWRSLFRTVLYHVPGLWHLMKPDMNDLATTPWRPFCSEAVAAAYSWNFIDLCPNHADRVTEPGDLPRGGRLEYQFTLQ